ncbi:MAG: MaoC/PaaZ C-terminal domain-containing protein [Lautropia sp.]
MPLHYEDFSIGQTFTTLGRTITESDLVLFAGMTGDNSALHTDEEYARHSVYGQRLVHGMLAVSIALGLISRTLVFEGTGIAFLGMDRVLFHKPIFVGDTVTARFTIASMRETKKADRGVVVRHVELFNQREESVLEFDITGLVLRR